MNKNINDLINDLLKAKYEFSKRTGADFSNLVCTLYLDKNKYRDLLANLNESVPYRLDESGSVNFAGFEIVQVQKRIDYINICIKEKGAW
jgi:hypothetical protein